jgi:anaerobic magnesium-protoporphyrin IX monomethyl ester cyclase
MAYPGSPLYEEAVRNGWRLPETWSGYSQHAVDTLPLPTRHISAGDVLRFRDRAFDTYFRHEPYLRMVKEKFGDATVAHIREMTSHMLERKYSS